MVPGSLRSPDQASWGLTMQAGQSPAPDAAAPGLSPEAERLLARAREHRLGVKFLVDGYPETVAVTHGVHPRIVHETRDWVIQTREHLA